MGERLLNPQIFKEKVLRYSALCLAQWNTSLLGESARLFLFQNKKTARTSGKSDLKMSPGKYLEFCLYRKIVMAFALSQVSGYAESRFSLDNFLFFRIVFFYVNVCFYCKLTLSHCEIHTYKIDEVSVIQDANSRPVPSFSCAPVSPAMSPLALLAMPPVRCFYGRYCSFFSLVLLLSAPLFLSSFKALQFAILFMKGHHAYHCISFRHPLIVQVFPNYLGQSGPFTGLNGTPPICGKVPTMDYSVSHSIITY